MANEEKNVAPAQAKGGAVKRTDKKPGFFERVFPSAGLMDCFRTADRTGRCLLLPDEGQRKELSALLTSFEKALQDERPGSDTMRDTLLAQLLITVNRISAADAPAADRAVDEKIGQTLSYINENLTADLSIDTLADRVFLSRYHFMRLFKEQTGSTVHQYVRQKRLLYAARLIREGVPGRRLQRLFRLPPRLPHQLRHLTVGLEITFPNRFSVIQ